MKGKNLETVRGDVLSRGEKLRASKEDVLAADLRPPLRSPLSGPTRLLKRLSFLGARFDFYSEASARAAQISAVDQPKPGRLVGTKCKESQKSSDRSFGSF